ncbi:peroxiredoxin-like family protein [Rossellomorea aquimaris]|uniref:peroxiredoxin-like family protein n=1 Tax=Rossellomorea aquimaris TaxID=189382 RepID=UPI0005C87920|nr:peroxiredoxin-like family protein [Rossellomorea aquimaris]
MLTNELKEVRERFFANAPEHVKESVEKATKNLIESGVATGLKEGDIAPDFTLVNAAGERVTLSEELKNGRVILNFYRGGWCPYCNLELRAYENILDEIKDAGALLIAISPQMPDQSLSTKEKNNLSFQVLSDPKQEVLSDYNLLFELPDHLIHTYKNDFNIDLGTYNNTENPWRLPVSGTFIINQDRTILLADANPDYMFRMDPETVIQKLKKN